MARAAARGSEEGKVSPPPTALRRTETAVPTADTAVPVATVDNGIVCCGGMKVLKHAAPDALQGGRGCPKATK